MMMACYSRCKSLSQPCYILYVSSGFLLALCNKQSTVVDFRPVKFISDARPLAQYITPPLWRDLVKYVTRKLLHTSSFSIERTDFKNTTFEKNP